MTISKAKRWHICLLVFYTFSSIPSEAHNGAMAFAYPVEGIVIDGDLSDWPSDIQFHEVTKAEYGNTPDSGADLSCRFRIGYNALEKTLLIAAEVTDDSFTTNPIPYIPNSWDSQDGFEVYIDRVHRGNESAVEQFSRFGDHLEVYGAADTQDFDLAVSYAEGVRRYECRIRLGEAFTLNRTFGFDISVTDKDKDGSFSWMGWGSGIGKTSRPDRNGDLILLKQGTPIGRVTGRVVMDERPVSGNRPLPPVAIQSLVSHDLWTRVVCDESGEFQAMLPAGTYTVNPVDTMRLRVDDSDHIHFHLGPGAQSVPPLRVSTLSPPQMAVGSGILFEDYFDTEKVDRFLDAQMSYFHIPGLSIAIIKDGEIVYRRGVGVKDLASREPVGNETLFEIASLTKPMFAFAVCRLVERGILDLDTPLYKYLPYPDIENDDRYKLITARFVLCHRTGFPNWRDGKLEIEFMPGTQQQYSGEGFEYLAKVISHLTGKSIAEVMYDEVFSLMGIENTYLTWTEKSDQSMVAIPHSRENFPMEKSEWSDPWVAGCLHTDAGNFARFMLGLIEGKGLSKAGYIEMFRPQFPVEDETADQNFSLGFVVGSSPAGVSYGHGGHNRGFTSAFNLYKEKKCGYVFSVNNYQGPEFDGVLKAFLLGPTDTSEN